MQRIIILGNSGAGKSTFARALGARLGLPVAHLDALFWQPGWREPEAQAFRDAVARAIEGDAWITDGNFVGRTFDLRMPRADTVIYIDQPTWLCVYRILWRWITAFGRRRPDLAEGCEEHFDPKFFRWVWTFNRDTRPKVLAAVAAHPVPLVRLAGDRAMARFLAALA